MAYYKVDQPPSKQSASKTRSRREEYSENRRYSPPQDMPVRDTSVLDYTPSGNTMRVKTKNVVFDNSDRPVVDKKRRPITQSGTSSRSDSRVLNNNAVENYDDTVYSLSDSWKNGSIDSGQHQRGRRNALVPVQPESNQRQSSSRQLATSNVNMKPENGAELSQFLDKMWQSRRMCDAIVKVNGLELPAHKLALAAYSDKLFAEYCSTPTNVSEISISNSSAQAVQDILKYIYTSELNINIRNVDPLLSCALQLGITSVISRCEQYLMNCNTDNVLAFMLIADKHQLNDILYHTLRHACNHFSSLTKSSVFLDCTFDQIRLLTGDDNLKLASELDVFFALLSWIDFNRQERLKYAVDLMSNVRFVHLSSEELVTHVEPVTHIFQIPECFRMLYSAFRYLALRYSNCHLATEMDLPCKRCSSSSTTRPGSNVHVQSDMRTPSAEILLTTLSTVAQPSGNVPIIGRMPGDISETNQLTDGVTDVYRTPGGVPVHSPYWVSYPPPIPLPPRPSVLLAIGGVDPYSGESDVPCRLMEQYNPRTNRWHTLTTLPDCRHHLGTVVLDGMVYVIGGSVLDPDDPGNLANPTDVCFRYDPLGNYWTRIASLRIARMYHAVAILEGVLYAVGGHDENGRALNSIEYYNPDTDTWGLTAPMTEAKIGVAAAGYKGMLYVVGGFVETADDKLVLDTVECYDPRTNSWTLKEPTPLPNCHANAVEANSGLYLIGGSTIPEGATSITSLASIFHYVEHSDKWERIQSMFRPRHDAGAAVIGPRIYIVGGVSSDENRTLPDVDCLNLDTGSWEEHRQPLSYPAMGVACCSLIGDDN